MDWYVFYADGKELLAITVKGSFAGEIQATKELLAHDHHIKPEDIIVKTEKRNTKGQKHEK